MKVLDGVPNNSRLGLALEKFANQIPDDDFFVEMFELLLQESDELERVVDFTDNLLL